MSLPSCYNLQEPVDHADGPTDPHRDSAVSSSSDGTTGAGGLGSPTAAAPQTASEVSYADDAAPAAAAGEQPLDLVQA